VRNIRGKIKNVGAPTFLGGVHSSRFCVSRGNKRDTRLVFVSRGDKGDSPPTLKGKSAQSAERARDSCDPKNERVCKSLKTRKGKCEELVTRANEQRGEEDRGGVLNWQGLAVRGECRGIVMRAVVRGRGHKDSCGVVRSGGRVGALASHGESVAKVNSIDK
jgi:hypothetical protein